jgi:hypothetical protein
MAFENPVRFCDVRLSLPERPDGAILAPTSGTENVGSIRYPEMVKSRSRQRVNVAKWPVCLLILLSAAVVLPAQAPGQGGPQETTYRRSVPHDAETMVGSAVRWRYQGGPGLCSTWYIPALELVTPPKHGTVRFVTTDVGAPRGSGCSNSVYGQAVLYHPAPGFVGEDQFTYNSPAEPMAMDTIRPPGLKTVIVTVRDQNTAPR